MSFVFNWPRFSDQFHYDAVQLLNNALNKGNKPAVIADKIEVIELEMGTQPPELDVREIGELTMDQFRGIFRLTYSGDAHLVLKTKVQANPLNHKPPDIHHLAGSAGMLAAKKPLVVPMLLRLSNFELASIVVLVVSKQKGITLVFKTDPLKRVDINSTFDSIAVIQSFIQKEIESQLKQMFREDLPGIIHRLSQTWIKAKVETPYITRQPSISIPRQPRASTMSLPPMSKSHQGIPLLKRRPVSAKGYSSPAAPASLAGKSETRKSSASFPMTPSTTPRASDTPNFQGLESYDPTYGLRPEGAPSSSPFRNFGALFTRSKGLADLAEDPLQEELEYDDEDEPLSEASTTASFDLVDWSTSQTQTPSDHPNVSGDHILPPQEYEQIPAVGGGVITRPRVIQSASSAHLSPSSAPQAADPFGKRVLLTRSSSLSQLSLHQPLTRTPTLQPGSYFSASGGSTNWSLPDPDHGLRPSPLSVGSDNPGYAPSKEDTESSLETPPSLTHTLSIPPVIASTSPPSTSTLAHGRPRRPSVSSVSLSDTFEPSLRKIILRPSMLTLNNSIHQLSTLSNSNHTLSPYERSLEHFTVRSGPPRPSKPSKQDMHLPVKARRKRTYHLGGKHASKIPSPPPPIPGNQEINYYSDDSSPQSPVPPSELDAMDMAHYFRSAPPPSPPSLRQR